MISTARNASRHAGHALRLALFLSLVACGNNSTEKPVPVQADTGVDAALPDIGPLDDLGQVADAGPEDGAGKPDGGAEDTTVEVDTGTDTPDAGTDDAAGPDAQPCSPGELGCACAADADCDSGLCADKDGAKVCASACVQTVPPTEICDGMDNDCNGKTDETTCNDANPCTVDLCGATSPTAPDLLCSHTPATEGGACEDGNACTSGDACLAGTCAGNAIDCDDKNACTIDTCDKLKGCAHENGTGACDADADACTSDDSCANGQCVPGKATVCDDKNPCTKDSCSAILGCVATATDAPCDDGSACTQDDACANGACQPGKAILCEDDNACTDDGCDLATGCTHTDNTLGCSDGNACTESDVCAGGKCASGKTLDCADGNPCTTDGCDLAIGCTHTDNAEACDDSSACTLDDVCGGGLCGGKLVLCDDKNACTVDVCVPASGCTSTVDEGAPCEDGSKCSQPDVCKAGACIGGPDLNCDDGSICTDDACDPAKGCTHLANTAGCDDGDECTVPDACKDGKCQPGQAKDCTDSNQCAQTGCDPKTGCTSKPVVGGACSDGDTCTVGDACANGACVSGKTTVCEDNNACTDDGCDAKTGCTFVKNTAGCSDDSVCTTGDVCSGGKCAPGPAKNCDDSNACTTDSCDAKLGCINTASSAPCDDGDACTSGDACTGGKCLPGGPIVCDDKNACTTDACKTSTGCAFTNTTKACSDNDACTLNDLCSNGACAPGAALKCDDGNPCTADSCDPAKGCVNKVATDGSTCNDGNSCTSNDKCTTGKCGGVGKNCDDGNPCTDDACANDVCSHSNNVQPCTDKNACTIGDVCKAGACSAGTAKVCDDGVLCTADSCDPIAGCKTAALTNCSGLPYAASFKCNDAALGAWKFDAPVGTVGWAVDALPSPPGFKSPDCSLNYNNGKDFACPAGVTKLSAVALAPVLDATNLDDKTPLWITFQLAGQWEVGSADNLDLEVTTDGGASWKLVKTFDPWTAPTWNSLRIDLTAYANKVFQLRFRFWTANCLANTGSGPFLDDLKVQAGPCKTNGDCDDGNVCSDDKCDVLSGKCTASANTAKCDDSNPCTTGDVCSGTICQTGATPAICDDKNPCTIDSCTAFKGCTYANNTAPCTDGDACTDQDICTGGACKPGAPKVCDDKNVCTDDTCKAATGCAYATNLKTCDDGTACTKGDLCANGVCAGGLVVCNDNNACTQDSCDSVKGCVTAPNSDACQDGSACTSPDVCKAGACVGGPAISCDDSNPCTTDSCDKLKGCAHVNNTAICNDANACTTGDVCANALCKGVAATQCDDNNPCTTDACNVKTGCTHAAATSACSDGDACTTGDTCKFGFCSAGAAVVCNDANPCTDDSCDAKTGCVYAANTAGCTDNSACTVGDKCSGGKCIAGAAPVCDDKNVCTTDSCDPTLGCVFKNNGALCDDGDKCTAGDACNAGACTLTKPVVCNDNNPCTSDSCAPTLGCVFKANTLFCTDNNVCTVGDKCSLTKCVVGPAKLCDDGNPCTKDSCDAIKGCVYTALPDTTVCDDGNACTIKDACKTGVCSGAGKNCDDLNPCTDDSCANNVCAYANNTKPCDDKNACTSGDLCKIGVCAAGSALVCNDGAACTVDSCDKLTGCKATPVSKCAAVPYVTTFACGDPALADWTLDAPSGSLGWAFDATPNPPAKFSAACSLNYNNGKDFVCPVGVSTLNASALAPTLDATAVKAGTAIWLDFQLAGTWENNTFDNLELEVSTDGAKTWTSLKSFDPWFAPSWNVYEQDLTAYAGKLFQLRLRFASTDCQFNDGTGPFIDDFAVRVGPCASAAACDDGNPCTTDQCDLAGKCSHVANTGPCNDFNGCTANDACSGGLCLAGKSPVICNDNNVCTDDTCNSLTGCVFTNNTAACTDGDACTTKDTCSAGACMPGTVPLACDDANQCTNDSCDKTVGCKYATKPGSGQPVCDGTVVGGRCYKAFASAKSWTAAESACATWAVGGHLTSVSSASENAAIRTVATGVCGAGSDTWLGGTNVVAANKATWSDGAAFVYTNWNAGEPNNGSGEPYIHMYSTGTWNNASAGYSAACYVCARVAPPTCDDGNACTGPDLCNATPKCAGGAVTCDDGNPCTTDACDIKLGCTFANNTAICNDANACTKGDVCSAGACKPGATLSCDDGNACTTDSCDKVAGCKSSVTTGAGVPACDGKVSGASCYKAYKDAKKWQEAESICTAWGGGGHLVSIGSATENGVVASLAAAVCGANADVAIGLNDATTEKKFAWTDGTATPYFNWSAGQPDDAGGAEDYVGLWQGAGQWNDFPATWGFGCYVCKRPAPTVLCNDGSACTTQDVCDGAGKCVGSVAPNCDDKTPCTNDACDAVAGCTHVNNTAACSDGDACTTSDVCGNAKCAGTPANCNDNNSCTVDTCDASVGCKHAASTGAACSDGSACTANDVCSSAGTCAGAAVVCNDGNACNFDACDPAVGCKYTTSHSACVVGEKLATTCSSCVATVCANDPFCCNNSWDDLCVNGAKSVPACKCP